MDEPQKNRYTQLVEEIFFKHYKKGATTVEFERSELVEAAERLKLKLPKNLGDVLYTFRYRGTLPESITAKAPPDKMWIIRPAGRGQYRFVLAPAVHISPAPNLVETKIPDGTPGIISQYAQGDEQALLAQIRYNRLIDIFTGLTCYSLQNHLRTTVAEMGQVETDELYVGLDKRGAHYVLPVQAKGLREHIGVVQIEQDIALCAEKFPPLICKPIAAQWIDRGLIALFELEKTDETIAIANERHYRLVHPEDLSAEELKSYQSRSM
ncbi:MAG: endonuclease [Anaerolineae bacterium]